MNILITGSWLEGKNYIEKIENIGHNVKFLQYEKDILPCEYEWVEGLICNGIFLHHKIEKFINLKYIQLTSVGYDRVPMDYVKKHNIKINNAQGVYSIPMAEFALAGVLSLYKSMNFFYENQKKNFWEKKRDLLELNGKTVTVLGCGNVGCECAKRFKAFGCRVLGLDVFNIENPFFDKIYNINHLNDILSVSDILVLTMPLSEDTYHLFNEDKFELLKENCIIVNISRGAVIDTNALLKYIDKIDGAVLDVFEEEPLNEDSPLWQKNNVIITPHNSFVSNGNNERLSKVVLGNLEGINE